jgi:hypothetical protein
MIGPLRAQDSIEAARKLGTELRAAWSKDLPATVYAAVVAPPGFAPQRTASANAGGVPGLADARADAAAYTAAARAALEQDRIHRAKPDHRGSAAEARRKFYAAALQSVPVK